MSSDSTVTSPRTLPLVRNSPAAAARPEHRPDAVGVALLLAQHRVDAGVRGPAQHEPQHRVRGPAAVHPPVRTGRRHDQLGLDRTGPVDEDDPAPVGRGARGDRLGRSLPALRRRPAAEGRLDGGERVDVVEVAGQHEGRPDRGDLPGVERRHVVAGDRRHGVPGSGGRAAGALVGVEERRDQLDRPALRGDRPLLLDLGEPLLDVPSHLGRRERRLGEGLTEEVQRILEVPFGDVDVDADPGLGRTRPERDALPLEQQGELARRVGLGALVEGARHDRRDALLLAGLPGQRERDRQAYRVHVLARHVVDDDLEAVRQGAPLGHREGVGLRRDDVRARDVHGGRAHAAASCSSTR